MFIPRRFPACAKTALTRHKPRLAVETVGGICHEPIMASRSPAAGGFFLIAPIVAGFLYGLTTGEAMAWTFIGLAVGLGLALLVWLIDRRRT